PLGVGLAFRAAVPVAVGFPLVAVEPPFVRSVAPFIPAPLGGREDCSRIVIIRTNRTRDAGPSIHLIRG
ncbi:hypothetical protein ACFQ07_14620, partial [Actinomadura adrarensis]